MLENHKFLGYAGKEQILVWTVQMFQETWSPLPFKFSRRASPFSLMSLTYTREDCLVKKQKNKRQINLTTIKRMARACTQRPYRVQEVRLSTIIILRFQLYLLIFLTSSCCSVEVGRFSRPVLHVSWIRDNLYPLRVYFNVHKPV